MTETTAEAAALTGAPSRPKPGAVKAIIVASIGNALEWFDLIVFGFLSVVISGQFFPEGDETVRLLLTLLTFGLAFVMRPLGAIVIGRYADRQGRMKAMVLGELTRRDVATGRPEMWYSNLTRVGNIGSAAIFVILDEMMTEGLIKDGDTLLCMVPESGRFVISFMHLTAVSAAAMSGTQP